MSNYFTTPSQAPVYAVLGDGENLKLITTLESAITGLNKAGWEYPFGTFLWDVSEKGAFSMEKIFDTEIISEDNLSSSFSESFGASP